MSDPQETTMSTPEKNDVAHMAASNEVSPNTLVKKADANAMRQQQAQRKTQREDQEEEEEEEEEKYEGDNDEGEAVPESASKRIKVGNSVGPDHNLMQLEELWSKENVRDGEERREAAKRTREILESAVNDMIQDGVRAHQEWARTHQELKMAKEAIAAKTREIKRLRATDQKNRESISNLLRTLDSSNEATKDKCQAKLVEARLRADLLHTTAKRDEAMEEHAKTERRCKLLEDDLTDTKTKLTRVQQEKMRAERDQQATMSLANALQGNNQSDVDYYKRKVTELNTHIQGLTAILTERNRQIESLRREKERFMSQNRLASYRADGERKKRLSL